MQMKIALLAIVAMLTPLAAHASFLSGETLDSVADVLAVIVIFLVPIVGIVLFWLVHIQPEKVAEKRHHPQKDAIKAVCLLSLFFGGLLWPIAWIWAYSKPVVHKLAYGTDKHEDYYQEEADALPSSGPTADVTRLREEMDAMEKKGTLTDELRSIRAQLAALEARSSTADAEGGSI